jgi:hypothetical protein
MQKMGYFIILMKKPLTQNIKHAFSLCGALLPHRTTDVWRHVLYIALIL